MDHKYDHVSIWLSNRQLLEHIDIEQQQEFIIENVFGGFENILKILMRHKNALSLKQHIKLQQALTPKCNNPDICNNYQSNQSDNNKLCIGDIPNDCLSHIITFLKHQNKVTMQKTCRLFAILARQNKHLLSYVYK